MRPEFAHLETNADLDRAESLNIADAMSWALSQEWTPASLLQSGAIREVHQQMLGEVWVWAGTFRTRDVNIGNCPSEQVPVRMEQILGNFAFQIEAGRPAADVCTEFHHALTQVHAFVNGNGRHARLVTELLAEALGLDPESLTWGGGYEDAEKRRDAYLDALRLADQGDCGSLREFMFN